MKKGSITQEMREALARAGSNDESVALAASHELAIALTLPLRQGVMNGANSDGIWSDEVYPPGNNHIEYPLDFLSPGTEKDYVAYAIPNQGKIPEFAVQGDYVMVPIYDVGASIDCNLKFARDARWDVQSRMLQVLEAMFLRKNNDDAWHTLLAAAQGRSLSVYDDAATAGFFTKRLLALAITVMRRYAGGNYTSSVGKLTDVWGSPEVAEDVRSWDLTQVDDVTRRQIFMSGEGEVSVTRIFGVNLHVLDELGVSQVYQNYYTDTLGGSLPGSKTELLIGLDLSNNDSFLHPISQPLEVFEDKTLHRQRRQGWYGWLSHGYSVMDERRTLVLAA